MEGGGERKRKSGHINLDWDILLSIEDDEPPPELVIEAAAADKSKPQAAEVIMLGEKEEPHMDLQRVPERELMERITRGKSILIGMSHKLYDGGEKLRASLKRDEAELERRKLLKADDKCKKATPLAYKSTVTGATNDFASRGVLPPVSASQSEFASHFCSKLDEKRPSKSFEEELFTLNHCDHKRENRPFLAQRTEDIGLSSRQAPFKSPNYLSVHTNGPPQSNREHLGSYSSSPSPRQSDKDFSGYFEKKESTLRFQPMRNAKRNNRKNVVLVDEEELEVDAVNQMEQVGQSSKETTVYYPSRDDPEAVEIRDSDMKCLAPESYLSSTIMNFYIQYLQKLTSPRTRKRCDYHFFNTYFYKKLKRDVWNKMDKETSFVKFRRWWKGVNIFEKAYVFLPIHENLHWSLIIICIPNKEDESGPIILHLDSLGLHFSKSIFNDVKSFLIEEWKFLRQKVLPELPIPENIWDKLSRRIDEKVIEVPQQRNEYDCGLFVLFFMERFLEEAPERLKKKDLDMFGKQWFRPEEASSLRKKISNLLVEFKNANGGTCILDQ